MLWWVASFKKGVFKDDDEGVRHWGQDLYRKKVVGELEDTLSSSIMMLARVLMLIL